MRRPSPPPPLARHGRVAWRSWALALPTMNAVAAEARVVVAGTAPVPANVTVVNQAITTTFDVTLAPRSALDCATSSRASPTRRHRTTATSSRRTQFAHRFGASASEVDAVRAYFGGFGLRVGTLSKGRLVLHVTGTTTQIADAFSARVETVRRSNGVLAAQLTTKGTVPARVAHDIAGVAGLSTVVQPSTNLVLSHLSSRTARSRRRVRMMAANSRRRRTPTGATRPSNSRCSTDSTRCGRTTSPARVKRSPSTS